MAGRAGFEAVTEHKIMVTAEFARLIDEDDGFELMRRPDSDILLFRALFAFLGSFEQKGNRL